MSDSHAGAIRELIRLFCLALEAKRHRRLAVFERLAVPQYAALRTVHEEFHRLLFPVVLALEEIEGELKQSGNEVWTKIDRLAENLSGLVAIRNQGAPQRHEVYQLCLILERTGFRHIALKQPLSEGERAMVRSLMHAICNYFRTGDEYQHEFGSTLAGMIGTVDMWRATGKISEEVVAEARANLLKPLSRMSAKWTKVVSIFLELELCLSLGIKLDPPPPSQVPIRRLISQRDFGFLKYGEENRAA